MFLAFFFYFFIVEKHIIQFVLPTSSEGARPMTNPAKTYEVKKRLHFPVQTNNWGTFKPVLMKFLQTLFLPPLPLLEVLNLRYVFNAPNKYDLRPTLAKRALERYVIRKITTKVAFYDYKVEFFYEERDLTVKIKLTVLNHPQHTVAQVFALQLQN